MTLVKELMHGNFCVVRDYECVGSIIRKLNSKNISCFIIENEGVIEGAVSVRNLLGYPDTRFIGDCGIEPITFLNKNIGIIDFCNNIPTLYI